MDKGTVSYAAVPFFMNTCRYGLLSICWKDGCIALYCWVMGWCF